MQRIILPSLALLVLSWSLYSPTLRFGRLDWDDQLHLSDNPFLQTDSPDRFAYFWREPYGKMYVPIAYNTWAVLYAAASHSAGHDARDQVDYRWLHAANVAVHAANTVLVFLLISRLGPSVLGAWVGAVLFCVHPLQVEAVAWLSEWRGLLATLFALLAIHGHLIRWHIHQRRQWLRITLDIVVAMLSACAMLSKPVAVVLPAVLLVLSFMQNRSLQQMLLPILPIALIATGILIIQSNLQAGTTADAPELWKRPFLAGEIVRSYLSKLVVPVSLSADYAMTPLAMEGSMRFWFAWISPVILGGAMLWTNNRIVISGFAIFLIALAPVLGFLWFEFQLISSVADRYFYLPMIGVSMIAAAAVDRFSYNPARTVWIALLIMLATLTWRQLPVWSSDSALWRHALTVNPQSPLALCNVATEEVSRGNLMAAQTLFEKARQVAPTRANPLLGLASLARDRGDAIQAERLYRAAMVVAPHDAVAVVDLASLLAQSNRLDEAEALARRATEIAPNLPDAWNNLGAVLYQMQRFDEASKALLRAIDLHPRHPNAYNALARVQAALNDSAAEQTMANAARFSPADPSPCIWLGKQSLKRQEFELAERWFREASKRDPKNLDALNDLGQTLGLQGRADESIAVFQAALQIAPDHPVLTSNLAAAEKLRQELKK